MVLKLEICEKEKTKNKQIANHWPDNVISTEKNHSKISSSKINPVNSILTNPSLKESSIYKYGELC